MKWLLVLILVGQGKAVGTLEYASKEACDRAARAFITPVSGFYPRYVVVCTNPKTGETFKMTRG